MRDASLWAAKNSAACTQILAKAFKANPDDLEKSPRVQFAGRLTPAILAAGNNDDRALRQFPSFPADSVDLHAGEVIGTL